MSNPLSPPFVINHWRECPCYELEVFGKPINYDLCACPELDDDLKANMIEEDINRSLDSNDDWRQ